MQGAGNGRALSSEGGGKAFGIMTKNEASPLCLNKALKGSRRATGQFRNLTTSPAKINFHLSINI